MNLPYLYSVHDHFASDLRVAAALVDLRNDDLDHAAALSLRMLVEFSDGDGLSERELVAKIVLDAVTNLFEVKPVCRAL